MRLSKLKLFFVLIFFIILSNYAFSFDLTQCESDKGSGFFPENNLKIKVNQKGNSMISEQRFNLLLNKIENAFQPLFKSKDKKLIINKDWNCDRVNAFATRGKLREIDNVELDEAIVEVSGGLARYPLINEDAFLLIVCHELGHHVGGAPKKFRGNTRMVDWAAAEGQADYFATSKCLKKIYESEDFNLELDKKDVNLLVGNEDATKICEKDKACIRSVSASLVAAKVYASVSNSSSMVSIFKNDPTQVSVTNMLHSKPQCRLDTMVAGTLCPIDYRIDFDDIDPTVGACLKKGPQSPREERGARPACWFKEN